MGWLDSVEHSRWLSMQIRGLLKNGHAAQAKTGFGYFTDERKLDTERPIDLAITARMTFVYSLGTLLGIPGSRRYCDHGIRCMQRYFYDNQYGGWFTSIKHEPDSSGQGIPWDEEGAHKWQYAHAFMILAAAAAAVANRPGAVELLRYALEDQEAHWFVPETGLVNAIFTRDWKEVDDYRGLASLMHTVEAYLAAAEAANNVELIERAEGMLQFINREGQLSDWRIPEHYDSQWRPVYEYGKSDPGRHYFPFGFLVGHGMELCRLAVQTKAAFISLGRKAPAYLQPMAESLFERARLDGWRRNGNPGFLLSTDFQGQPVIEDRYQWVVSEGIVATTMMRRTLLDDGAPLGAVEVYDHCYRSWLDYVNDYLLVEPGVLIRVLNADNEPTVGSMPHRPDIYHSMQAMLAGRLPVWPPMATALSHGLLDKPQRPAPESRSWRRTH